MSNTPSFQSPELSELFSPAARAQALSVAATLPDDQAGMVLEFSDTTPLGHRAKIMRYGIGAAAGLVLGVIVGKVIL